MVRDCFTYVPYNDILINSPRFAVTLKLLSHLFLTNGTVLLHWADEIRVRSEKEIEAHHRFLRLLMDSVFTNWRQLAEDCIAGKCENRLN